MSDTLEGMRRLYQEALDLAERKNHDYGDAWRSNGWQGNLSRIFEKVQRLRTLLWNDSPPEARVTDEDVRQTAVDLLNTLTFFIMNLEAGVKWGHELPFHNIRIEQPSTGPGGLWDTPIPTHGHYEDPIQRAAHSMQSDYEQDMATERLATLRDQLVAAPKPVVFEPDGSELPAREPGAELSAEGPSEEPKTEQKPSPTPRQPKRR